MSTTITSPYLHTIQWYTSAGDTVSLHSHTYLYESYIWTWVSTLVKSWSISLDSAFTLSSNWTVSWCNALNVIYDSSIILITSNFNEVISWVISDILPFRSVISTWPATRKSLKNTVILICFLEVQRYSCLRNKHHETGKRYMDSPVTMLMMMSMEVRLRLWNAATSGPIVHPPGDT
jgi:hypothetical protein